MDKVFLLNTEKLRSYVGRYISRPQDIEDIVQDVYLKSCEAQYKTKIDNISAYLFTTARNLSYKHNARHGNKYTDHLDFSGLSEVLGTSDSAECHADLHREFGVFCEAVRKLPPKCRKVFILKKVYGLKNSEISDRLEISPSTVNTHLAKGLSHCASYMRDHGYARKKL